MTKIAMSAMTAGTAETAKTVKTVMKVWTFETVEPRRAQKTSLVTYQDNFGHNKTQSFHMILSKKPQDSLQLSCF